FIYYVLYSLILICFFICYCSYRYLHSFPTRRSSDLLFILFRVCSLKPFSRISFSTCSICLMRLELFLSIPSSFNLFSSCCFSICCCLKISKSLPLISSPGFSPPSLLFPPSSPLPV